MDFGDYVRLVRRSAWIIVALTILGVIVGSGLTLLQKPQFQSTATGVVSTRTDSLTDLGPVTTFSQQVTKNFATFATTSTVLQRVQKQLKLPYTVPQLKARVSAAVPPDGTGLMVTATAPTGQQSADIANGVMSQLNTMIPSLLPGSDAQDIALRVINVDHAVAPPGPFSPRPLQNIALGALFGLILGLLVAVLRQLLDSRVSTLHDIERLTSRPVLGLFLRDEGPTRRAVSMQDFMASSGAEAFRTLRTNLRYLDAPGTSRSFIVSSPAADEDRAGYAANLAIAIADLGTRVIVVDADLRRSTMASYLGVSNDRGLSDVLAGLAPVDSVVQRWAGGRLDVLPAGPNPSNPNELLQAAPMAELAARLHLEYDAVIFNTPPLLVASDAAVVATVTNGALIVCRMGRTRRAQLQAGIASLTRVGSPVLGIVATGLRDAPLARYGSRPPRRVHDAAPVGILNEDLEIESRT